MYKNLKNPVWLLVVLVMAGGVIACNAAKVVKAEQNDIASQATDTLPAPQQYSSLYGKPGLKDVPLMYFEQRMVDLGRVKKGEKRSLSYHFTNKGDKELSIAIITACECTKTNVDDISGKIFKPGESGTIDVVFDSSEKDVGELIDIEILLDQTEPGTDIPIIEKLYYEFEIE